MRKLARFLSNKIMTQDAQKIALQLGTVLFSIGDAFILGGKSPVLAGAFLTYAALKTAHDTYLSKQEWWQEKNEKFRNTMSDIFSETLYLTAAAAMFGANTKFALDTVLQSPDPSGVAITSLGVNASYALAMGLYGIALTSDNQKQRLRQFAFGKENKKQQEPRKCQPCHFNGFQKELS